jgi:lysophospholipase L1-like esterase
MPLGDSQVEGFLALKAQPPGIALSVGCDGTGTWRRHLLNQVAALGIPIPQSDWMRGSRQSSDPNIQQGQNHHQGISGITIAALDAQFATFWGLNQATAIVLLAGTNDWQVWLEAHPLDYMGAAQSAAAALQHILATIASVAGPHVVVGVVTPPTGTLHVHEANLFVPLAEAVIASAQQGGQDVYLLYNATLWLQPTPPGPPTNLQAGVMDEDGVHLNEIGQQILAGGILRGMVESPFR